MFFKNKKKKLTEAPLGYWEEKSYMLVIPKNEEEDLLRDLLDKIDSIDEVTVKDNHYNVEQNTLYVNMSYEGFEYEVGFYVGNVSVPEYYLNSYTFKDEERKAILSAKRALTIFMKFSEDAKKSYHLQLKLAVAIVPDLIGVMDESAEKMLPARWGLMTANSKILPSSENIFTVQAVSQEKEVWLHTHGLNRCGITELEILKSSPQNYRNHYYLISTYAKYFIDRKVENDTYENGIYIGCLINGEPVVATCRSWTEGIFLYDNLELGGLKDRQETHNSKTSIIFLYKSEDDENKKVLSKISIYDNLWGDNPIFFISNEETARMKQLAIERFNYVKDNFKEENTILIKIGLPLSEEGQYEHIWFELLEIKGNKFKAKLTQEPYNVEDIHEGYISWYTKDDITDWIIYTPTKAVSSSSAYLLEK